MPQARLTNNTGIGLGLAVWLAHDDYDYVDKPNYISVTTLIKPVRQIILASRVPAELNIADISDRLQSRIGQALHGDIERSWKQHYATSLAKLGYPKAVIDRVRINPEAEEPDTLPVYTEIRTERAIEGFTVGGKIDLIIEGRLTDAKKTSVWGYMAKKGVETSWRLQGSLYRWLNPDKVTHSELTVQYLLLDWSRALAKQDPNYPSTAVPQRLIPLMSVAESEKWVRDKLRLLRELADAPEEALPECSDEDLWRTDPTYKYYANADAPAGTRSTKNFSALSDAMAYRAEKGKGRVDMVPGQVKACLFCAAAPLCTQKDRLIATGHLILK